MENIFITFLKLALHLESHSGACIVDIYREEGAKNFTKTAN